MTPGLPANGTPWPPKPYDVAFAQIAESHVWWEGTSSKLTNYYSQQGRATSGFFDRAAQAMQTLRGKPKLPRPAGSRLHVPIAADLANTSANLLFSSPPSFRLAGEGKAQAGNDVAAARLDLIANTPQMHSQLLVSGESAAALSGVFLRVVWDGDVADHAWIDTVDADRAIPEFQWGRVRAITFWNDYRNGDVVHRHLQRYEPGRIVHALYEGSGQDVGVMIPLTEHPATAGLAQMVSADGAIITGSSALAAAYIPNQRPNPAWRHDDQLKNLGRADISADITPLMWAADEAFSSLIRDIRLAKARLVVSKNMVDNAGPGNGGLFDLDHEVFEAVGDVPGADGSVGSVMQAHQFDIRVDEHLRVVEALTREILRRVGYSPLTFGISDEVAMTAAETVARERASNTTRAAKTRLWQPELSRLLRAMLEVDAFQFSTGATITENVDVEWPPSVQESSQELAQTTALLYQAQAASTQTRVAMMHPDWDREDIDTEAQRVADEFTVTVPDPFGGFTPDGPGNPVEDDEVQ